MNLREALAHLKDPATEKPLDRTQAYQGRIITVCDDRVVLSNGAVAKREVIYHPGAAAILALTEDGELVLERQYRYPVDRYLLELPAGKVEPGETPLAAAKRELEEETGFVADSWRLLTSFATSPGISSEFISLFLATPARLGRAHPEEDEQIDVILVQPQEITPELLEQDIFDAKTLVGLLWLQRMRSDPAAFSQSK